MRFWLITWLKHLCVIPDPTLCVNASHNGWFSIGVILWRCSQISRLSYVPYTYLRSGISYDYYMGPLVRYHYMRAVWLRMLIIYIVIYLQCQVKNISSIRKWHRTYILIMNIVLDASIHIYMCVYRIMIYRRYFIWIMYMKRCRTWLEVTYNL